MSELRVKLTSFEGPLDLLLHLIKELKVDIYDIPMVELTQQYLSFLHSMKEMELEIAGDYLVMAATLLEIKARTLIPRPVVDDVDGDEAEEDPRKELVDRLLEYKQFQASAKILEDLSLNRSSFYSKEASDLSFMQQTVPLREGEVSIDDLWKALQKMALRNQARQPLRANLYHEVHTVQELMDSIIYKIESSKEKQINFTDCFPEWNRHAIVTSFLAMLQLVRQHSISIIQSNPYQEILIVKNKSIKEKSI